MPDKNKFEALAEAGFQVKLTCLRCAHFVEGANGWGTCWKIRYQHLKHTSPYDDPKGFRASVPVDGWCPQHEVHYGKQVLLGAHQEFVEEVSDDHSG